MFHSPQSVLLRKTPTSLQRERRPFAPILGEKSVFTNNLVIRQSIHNPNGIIYEHLIFIKLISEQLCGMWDASMSKIKTQKTRNYPPLSSSSHSLNIQDGSNMIWRKTKLKKYIYLREMSIIIKTHNSNFKALYGLFKDIALYFKDKLYSSISSVQILPMKSNQSITCQVKFTYYFLRQ